MSFAIYKKKRGKGSVAYEHGQSGSSNFPDPQLPARPADELNKLLWPDESMGEDFMRAVAEEKRQQAGQAAPRAAQTAGPGRANSSDAHRAPSLAKKIWPDSVLFGSPEEFTRIMGRPPADLQPSRNERRTFKPGVTLLGSWLGQAEPEKSHAQTPPKPAARAQERTATSGQLQRDDRSPVTIPLDRRNETAVNKYKLSEKDIFTQNQARHGQVRLPAGGIAGCGAPGQAAGSGAANDSTLRRNETAGPGLSAHPASEAGETPPAALQGSAGMLAKSNARNYSVYWRGINPKQLEYISEEVRRLIAKSDTLKRQLRDHKDVKIVYGPTENGTSYNSEANTITIAEIKREDAKATLRSLAHESGHIDGPELDCAFPESMVNSEGAAQFNTMLVRDEILANGGEDIGPGGSLANQALYLEIYKQYLAGKISYAEAINKIGKIYAQKERPSPAPDLTYDGWYADQCAE